jgi:vacuolar-type H+-ATPase subunit I/STV1
LLLAEKLSAKATSTAAVKKISEQVKNTFHLFRMLMRKYAENIEVVDPMLRNNKELSDVVGDLEKAWALAKDHMLEEEKLSQLA